MPWSPAPIRSSGSSSPGACWVSYDVSTPRAMSADCSSMATMTPHVSASKPYFARSYPMSLTLPRTSLGTSTYVSVEISPATTTSPVVTSVSHATRPLGSSARTASSTASEIWSAILSGWPSVTDSEVNGNERAAIGRKATCAVGGLLRRGLASHELVDERRERHAVEDRAHAFRDRQLDAEPVREVAKHRGGRQTFDHHPDLGGSLVGRGALGDELAGAAVAPRGRPACDDEVAHAGQPGERVRPSPGHLRQPPHLRQAAGDERRLPVVPEPEPVRAAGCECDHVLRRRAELDAHDVLVDIHAEDRRVHGELEPDGELEVVAGDHRCRRESPDDPVDDVRPGEHGDGVAAHECREPLPRPRIEALGKAQDRCVAGQAGHDLAEHPAGHRDDQDVGVGERRLVDQRCGDPAEIGVPRVPRVPARRGDRGDLLRIACCERHVVALVAEETGERRPPGPGSYHHEPHSEVTKSIETGTPSSLN